MKKLIFLFVVLLFPFYVKADKIYSVDMKIDIKQDGTANITEIWDVKASGGSEWYKQINNLGNSNLSNYKVYMDWNPLQYKEYWNINASISEKAGYYGINKTNAGLELCFGKTDKNRHKFILTYSISNYVFNTNDSQVLYWTLIPSVDLDNFSIEVNSYYSFPDNLDVWGYGYKGLAYVKDGKIKMSNEGKLKNEYVVLLAKFPLNTFTTSNRYLDYNTFNDVYENASYGSFKYDYNKNSMKDKINDIMEIILYFMPIVFFVFFHHIIGFIISLVRVFLSKVKNKYENYVYKDNKKIKKGSVPFFREIPCNNDMFYASFLININNFTYNDSNIIEALILKLIKDKNMIIKKESVGRIFKRKKLVIEFSESPYFYNEYEKKLFLMMKTASKDDNILKLKEFKKWIKGNYYVILDFQEGIFNDELKKLCNNQQINLVSIEVKRNLWKYMNVMDDNIYNDSMKVYGLKRYLEKFSRINTRETIEVHLWDDYLIYASLFGIADKVSKQFRKVNSEILKQEILLDYNTMKLVNKMSSELLTVFSSKEISTIVNDFVENVRASDGGSGYSSGGGGFSSGGGGGGSFGGGGGSRMGGR